MTTYSAFLVRWQTNDDDTRWYAEVENAHTGEKMRFADRHALMHFLWKTIEAGTDAKLNETELEE